MRQFARPYPIERLSLEARVLYTGFLAFLVLGLLSSAWLYDDSFGDLSARSVAVYYGGEEAGAGAAPGGPALELPEDEPPALRLQKPPRQVLETFHFHLFTVPVVLLIIGHLFMLTALGTRLKVAVIAFTSFATALHLLAPLLVRFVSPAWAPLLPVTAVAAGAGWLPLCLWPLWEMWRPRGPQEAES